MRQTDSMSNLSDMSGNTAVQTNRPRMDVACVIDTVHAENIAHRKCAFDELKQACSLTNANLHQIQVITKYQNAVTQKCHQVIMSFRSIIDTTCHSVVLKRLNLHFSLKNWISAKRMC